MKIIWATITVILAVFLAQQLLPAQPKESVESQFLSPALSLLNSSSEKEAIQFKHVAIGYNTNTDLVADAVDVLSELGFAQPPKQEKREVHSKISRLEDFSELVSYFMQHGSACERIIVDDEACAAIVGATRRARGVEHIGGNAALIAMRMAERTKVTLAGNLSDDLKKQLHRRIGLLQGIAPSDPVEAHLILEYKKGQKWGDIEAPRANRVIVHCDKTNAEFKVVEPFHANVKSADLIIISGLHLLDSDTVDIQEERLQKVLKQTKPEITPLTTPIHLELASMSNLDFIERIAREFIPNVDSMGLNEQELGYLYFALLHPANDFKTPALRLEAANKFVKQHFTDPSFDTVAGALNEIFSLDSSGKRTLERIHFHSLKYHIIATRKNGKWGDATLGVVQGSLAATMSACGFSSPSAIDLGAVDILPISGIEALLYDNFVYRHNTQHVAMAAAPVLVCKRPGRTVGLGDAISAAGLLYHSFNNK